jgi:FkbM family methyltransferase
LAEANSRIAQLFLRFGPSAARLRTVPFVGPCLRWIGQQVVPRYALTWVQVRQGPAAGIWLRLNPRTGHDVMQGAGETEVQKALYEHLTPGMTFYDVGANIGFFSLLAARLTGPSGRVVAFEADPEIAGRLREHGKRNGFSWLSVEEKAVCAESGASFFLRCDPGTSPDRGLGRVVAVPGAATIQVQSVSLDDYVQRSPAPDFIKCDVEGAEVEVFQGARRLLTEKRPIVVCEMHGEDKRHTLVAEFSRLGYRCMDCDEHHVLALPQ